MAYVMPESAVASNPVETAPVTPAPEAAPATPAVAAPVPHNTAEDRALDLIAQATDENGQLSQAKLADLQTREAEKAAARDDKGRFAKNEDNDDTPADEAQNDDKPQEPERQRREELVLARQALRRDQWTEAELKDIGEDQILKFGLKAKARQDAQAREWQRTKNGKPTQTDHATDGEEGLQRTRPEPNRETDTDPGDEPEGVEDVLGQLDEASANRLRGELTKAQQRAESANREAIAMRLFSVRQDLAKEFADITSDEAFGRVVKTMDRIDPRGESLAQGIEGVRRIMRDASWIEFGEKVKTQTRQQTLKAATADLDGQPHVQSRKAADRSVTRDDWEDAAAEAAGSSSTLEEAQRRHAQILGKRGR
jgi:hypothetical protein